MFYSVEGRSRVVVRNKLACNMCGRKICVNGLINVKGSGRVCYRCRQTLPSYRLGFNFPQNKTLKRFLEWKNKKKGEITK